MEHQCHCGEAYADDIALKRHIKVVHRNNYWACSGEWVWDDGTESRCPQVCRDKFSLWKTFQGPNIKTGTSITVRWTAATGALMKEQHSHNISKTYTSESQWQMLRASKLSVQNARSHFHRKTKCGPIYSSVEMRTNLFLVQNVMKLSGIGTVYIFIRSKKHPQRAGDHSAYYKCDICPKEYTSISSRQ